MRKLYKVKIRKSIHGRDGSGCNGKPARRGLCLLPGKEAGLGKGAPGKDISECWAGANCLHKEEETPVWLTPRSRGRHQQVPKANIKLWDPRHPVSVKVGPIFSNSSKSTTKQLV